MNLSGIFFGWPQLIMAILFVMSISIHAAKHGDTNDARYTYFVYFTAVAIMVGLSTWGGFFANGFHWPQIVMVLLWSVGFVRTTINRGELYGNYNVFKVLFIFAIEGGLLYAGGFWTNG